MLRRRQYSAETTILCGDDYINCADAPPKSKTPKHTAETRRQNRRRQNRTSQTRNKFADDKVLVPDAERKLNLQTTEYNAQTTER